jgi:hypothetical protein
MLRAHKELIGIRRRHPWLVRARTERVHVSNEQLTYRVSAGDDALEVRLDLAGTPSIVIADGAATLWSA